MKQLVVIGNGMVGIRTVEEILKQASGMFKISVFGAEPHPNYNRIKLSNVLQGETTIDDIIMNDWSWYKEHGIDLYVNEEIIDINIEKKQVVSAKGTILTYDDLIIAIGSSSFILPIPGADKKGVTGFRDIADCEMMIKLSNEYKKAAVIGGGLLGLEAARGLLNLGMEVDVVHLAPHLMERQLDSTAGVMLKEELESQGMKFYLEKETTEILGDERVEGLRFKDGSTLDADLIVMAVGIKPNVDLARQSGIPVNRAIMVNDYMETEIPHVYAVGECVEHREVTYGLVAPLYEQAKVLASRITGNEVMGYEGSIVGTQLKVAGVDLFSAGEIDEDERTKAIKIHNEYDGVYKKILIRENRIVGIVLYGDTSDGQKLFRMLTKKEDVTGMTSTQILQAPGEPAGNDIASMPNDEIVCGCNGVTKKTIVDSIQTNGLTTIDEVGGCTNAGRSCGRCKSTVGKILAFTLGDSFKGNVQKKTLCSCTALGHDEVVAEIKSKGLMSTKEVMNVLGWKNEEGCSKCRPALNYLLGMIYPMDYMDERDSRLVNEKMHANIQKDGTYSVVPRMYGGVTTADDLKKIAQVAEKYQVPLVKLTGGQRIGLFGVKKEDLLPIWEELDMPSGYAYGKTLRTVKTCVGKTFCRYGTQDSMSLGIELEKKFERLDTPHKFKMGVSACPRNCAESGIKDIGFVGIDGGWEIYIGGNGGTDLRAGDLLCAVKTNEEAIEMTSALLQYYRETASYLERTAPWVERLGLESIKVVLGNQETRKQLIERLEVTLNRYDEPWKEALENNEIQDKYYKKRKFQVEVNQS